MIDPTVEKEQINQWLVPVILSCNRSIIVTRFRLLIHKAIICVNILFSSNEYT